MRVAQRVCKNLFVVAHCVEIAFGCVPEVAQDSFAAKGGSRSHVGEHPSIIHLCCKPSV